jgi:hypothetical protein
MMRRIAMSSKYVWTTLVAGGIGFTTAVAQPPTPPDPPTDRLFFLQNAPPLPALGGRIDIIRSEGGVPGPVVEGKPYSARSITESTQSFADGNRITQRNEAVIHRDSEGRTRHEQTLTGVGPWQSGEPVTMIHIHDPVAGKSYVLDPAAQTAREIRSLQMAIAHAEEGLEAAETNLRATWNIAVPAPAPVPAPGIGVERGVTVIRRDEGGHQNVRVYGPAAGAAVAVFPPGAAGAYEPGEDLGEQVLEGLLAHGTRLTDTIPAGTIGNERDIEIVTERWYSEDIEAMVLQRFSDPRFGETVYRLVNVVRGDPSPDLFQVPQGYEIETSETPRAGVRVMPGTAGQRIEFELQRTEPAPQ